MSEKTIDVPSCVEGVRCGDENAARDLMEHLYPLVVKLIRAHRPRRTQEEDLAQVIFIKIFTRLDSYSGKVPLEHWVSRVAVNTCLNYLKAERVRPEVRWADMSEDECRVVETLHRTQADLHPSKALAAREVLQMLLDRLPARDRMLVQLMHLEEKSIREIHAMTGWSEPVIKVRAFRARQKLKKFWRQLEFEENHESYRTSVAATVESSLAGA